MERNIIFDIGKDLIINNEKSEKFEFHFTKKKKKKDLNSPFLDGSSSPNLGWEPVLKWKSTNPEPDRFLGIILETRGWP